MTSRKGRVSRTRRMERRRDAVREMRVGPSESADGEYGSKGLQSSSADVTEIPGDGPDISRRKADASRRAGVLVPRSRPPPGSATPARSLRLGPKSAQRARGGLKDFKPLIPTCVACNSSRVGKRDRAPEQSPGKARVASGRQTTRDESLSLRLGIGPRRSNRPAQFMPSSREAAIRPTRAGRPTWLRRHCAGSRHIRGGKHGPVQSTPRTAEIAPGVAGADEPAGGGERHHVGFPG